MWYHCHHFGNGYGPGLEEQKWEGKGSGALRDCSESEFIGVGDILDALEQGCQTHFHQGPHQPRGCLQRAECNFNSFTVKE